MNINIKEDIKPLSLFRIDPGSVMKQVRLNQRPVVITERGKPMAVLVDLEEYEKQREKMELMEAILEGEKDFQEGHSKSLDQIFRESRQWVKSK